MNGILRLILIAVPVLVCCTPRTPPLPDRRVEVYGQAAARGFLSGEFEAALRLYGKAYAEAARFDIASLEARYLFNTGRILYECMLFDSAGSYFTRSAALWSRIGSDADAAIATVYTALSRAYLGETDAAQTLFRNASARCAAQDSMTVRMAALLLQLLTGKTADARRSADRLSSDFSDENDRLGLGTVYCYKAMAVFSEGDASGALLLLDSSLQAFAESPYRYRNWRSLEGKAIVSFCMHDSAAGELWYRRAKRAAPDLVRLPDVSVVRECPLRW